MFKSSTPLFATLFVGAFASAAMAQDATPSTADCEALFTQLDVNADGYLSETEAPREFARARVSAATLDAKGISKDGLLAQCTDAQWSQREQDMDAPLEGANSFTEEQARDRAISWNLTDVTTLVLDDKGIWRGAAKLDGAKVSVAIDYKGNVVTAPEA